jgi:hypothetical protein
MRASVFVAWAATCVVVNFLAISRWRSLPIPYPVMNVLTGTAVLHGWPVIEPDEWIVVEPAGGKAAVQSLTGTVEEWLPRLIGGGARAYSVAIETRRDEPGAWSPWCQRADMTFAVKPLLRRDEAFVAADMPRIREVWVESQVARGADRRLVDELSTGSAARIDWFPGFIVNDVVVSLIAAAGLWKACSLAMTVVRRRPVRSPA